MQPTSIISADLIDATFCVSDDDIRWHNSNLIDDKRCKIGKLTFRTEDNEVCHIIVLKSYGVILAGLFSTKDTLYIFCREIFIRTMEKHLYAFVSEYTTYTLDTFKKVSEYYTQCGYEENDDVKRNMYDIYLQKWSE